VPRIVAGLDAEGLPGNALGELDGNRVTIAHTAGGRSVLGCMNDLALTCRLAAEHAGGLVHLDVDELHHLLQRHLSAARDYVPAIDLITGPPPGTRPETLRMSHVNGPKRDRRRGWLLWEALMAIIERALAGPLVVLFLPTTSPALARGADRARGESR